MSDPNELRVGLGFDGCLQLRYNNSKTLDLPKGEAEARIREILEGFRRPLAVIRQEIAERAYADAPPVRRVGEWKLRRPATLKDLELE